MNIYMIRHTAVDVEPAICYGDSDIGLKETFEEEAVVIKNALAGIDADQVFTSPLSRCKRLADYCGHTGAIVDNRLKELNFGDWEMKRWDEVDMLIWHDDWINPPTPNGESFRMLADRVASFLDELRDMPHKNIFVFTHGGVVSCAKVYFNQVPLDRAMDKLPAYGEITRFNL